MPDPRRLFATPRHSEPPPAGTAIRFGPADPRAERHAYTRKAA